MLHELTRNSQPAIEDLRRGIAMSVFSDGLLSRKQLVERGKVHFPSADDHLNTNVDDEVMGNTLNLDAKFRDVINMLYPGPNAIFSVLLERKLGIHYPETTGLASARAQASFLVVCPVNRIIEQAEDWVEDEDGYTTGYSFSGVVAPSNFTYVVIPHEVLRNMGSVATPVGSELIIVRSNLSRFIYDRDKMPASVPDYESALRDIVKKITTSYWVHAVRLPLQEDVQYDQSIAVL